MQDGRTQEYNLNVAVCGWGMAYLLDVGYVGTQSAHPTGQGEFDQPLLAGRGIRWNGQTTSSINNVTARLPIQGVQRGSDCSPASVFVANYNALQPASRDACTAMGLESRGESTRWAKNLRRV